MTRAAWLSHGEDCECIGCADEKEYTRLHGPNSYPYQAQIEQAKLWLGDRYLLAQPFTRQAVATPVKLRGAL